MSCSSHRSLSEEQEAVRCAVLDPSGKDVMVVAGPGSGKTHTLVQSLASLVENGADGQKIVAITFTRNAAAEMRVRLLRRIGEIPALAEIQASTFHSWIASFPLRAVVPRHHTPILLDTAGLAAALHLFNPQPSNPFNNTEVNAAERHLEGCESFREMKRRNFNRIKEKENEQRQFANLVCATRKLRHAMRGTNIATNSSLMRSGIALARHLRPKDIERLCIDEVQDLNRTQMRFVQDVQERTGCRILAIGDEDQGIYKFRGASSGFVEFLRAKSETVTLRLTTNYRSSKNIVSLCEGWIAPHRAPALEKSMISSRDGGGLPIILLQATDQKVRGAHANTLFQACKEKDLFDHLGELGILKYSLQAKPWDLGNIPHRHIDKKTLPQSELSNFLSILKGHKYPSWLDTAWPQILDSTRTRRITDIEDRYIGRPGMKALLSALEALVKLKPEISGPDVADLLQRACWNQDFRFEGTRLNADCLKEEANLLTLHGSKGLEFRAVWITEPGYAFSEKDRDLLQGQPCLPIDSGDAPATQNQKTREALAAECRRLIYVGFSRAADLLVISAPQFREPKEPSHTQANEFAEALNSAIAPFTQNKSIEICKISTDADVDEFVETYLSTDKVEAFKNIQWVPPIHQRVESFTSLRRKKQGIKQDQDTNLIIRESDECPRPQSIAARIGDEFHRLMHLLCLQPDLVQRRLSHDLTTEDLLARVLESPHHLGHVGIEQLKSVADNYFSDEIHKPWQWLVNARSELPFSVLIDDPDFVPDDDLPGEDQKPEQILLTGYIDLVQYGEDGRPVRIVDYKTGAVPEEASPEQSINSLQLRTYRDAIVRKHPPRSVELINIYFTKKMPLIRIIK